MASTATQQHLASGRGKRDGAFRLKQLSAWIWVAPAILFVLIFLVYPTIETIWISFFNDDSTSFVGAKNYAQIFTDSASLDLLRNNLLWLVLATAGTVFLGLLIAMLVDRARLESVFKSAIFIPMAISFVGASVIWKFVYDYQPPGQPQIGLLNAIVTGTGHQPIGWLVNQPGNNLALIIIYIWMWTGFCMVILSAALKGVPTDILEAARCDGASELTIFFRIIVPVISPTIVVVATTMVINVLKVFDIVYTLTGGNFKTNVVAMEYYIQFYSNSNLGRGSALAVLLLIVIIPVMLINIRRFRVQEAQR
ncbi:MAG TPA: sugar ABC transporter permease [Ktedonobacteraceae bacterium]|nr:sugar ABC transporter permease [Ktedonobacteraceae bacterium]